MSCGLELARSLTRAAVNKIPRNLRKHVQLHRGGMSCSLTRLWRSCCYCSLFFSGVEQVLIWYHSSRFTAACPAAMAARWIRLRVWLLFKHPWFMKGKCLVFPSSCSPKNSCSLSTEYPNHKVGGLTEEDSAWRYISAPPGSRHRYNRDFVGCCLRKGQSITIDLI